MAHQTALCASQSYTVEAVVPELHTALNALRAAAAETHGIGDYLMCHSLLEDALEVVKKLPVEEAPKYKLEILLEMVEPLLQTRSPHWTNSLLETVRQAFPLCRCAGERNWEHVGRSPHRPPGGALVLWCLFAGMISSTPEGFPSEHPPPPPHLDSECASGCPWSTAQATAPFPGRPTPGVVKQDKSSGGSVDTTKTRSGPQRVRMSSGERPIGAAKGKQTNTEALYPPPPTPCVRAGDSGFVV